MEARKERRKNKPRIPLVGSGKDKNLINQRAARKSRKREGKPCYSPIVEGGKWAGPHRTRHQKNDGEKVVKSTGKKAGKRGKDQRGPRRLDWNKEKRKSRRVKGFGE